MKYLIDKTISFNTDDGTLCQQDKPEVVRLPVPAVRLLEEFTRSEGRELTREYLLDTVWENHGLQATDGNLRQYISILRRNLALLGCPELIVTIPKVGFKINADIPVVCLTGGELGSQGISQDSGEEEEERASDLPKVRGHHRFTWQAVALFVLLAAGLIFVWLWHGRTSHPDIPGHYISAEGCDITYVKDIPDATRQENVALINTILKKNNLQCARDNLVIFDKEISLSSENNSRIMLSFCYTGKNGEVISCENFYEYKRVGK